MLWKRIVEINDWENLEYFLGNGKKAPRLAQGTYMVQWPDGSVSVEKIVYVPHRARVYDMGHEYDVNTKKAVIKVIHRGIAVYVPVCGLRVLVG